MSGSAALAAAKRRRGDGGAPLQRIPENDSRPVPQQNVSPLQILAQHHKKLDLLYVRQDKINKVLDIQDDEKEENNNNLLERINNIERGLENDIGKPVKGVNDVTLQVDEYEKQIKELKNIILKVQSHSIEVSLELLLLKKKLNINETLGEEKMVIETDVTETDVTETDDVIKEDS
tara:strand:+ start:191 stop:718 length:528 start_codon:yes stop_codon:yes gene_type:complete